MAPTSSAPIPIDADLLQRFPQLQAIEDLKWQFYILRKEIEQFVEKLRDELKKMDEEGVGKEEEPQRYGERHRWSNRMENAFGDWNSEEEEEETYSE